MHSGTVVTVGYPRYDSAQRHPGHYMAFIETSFLNALATLKYDVSANGLIQPKFIYTVGIQLIYTVHSEN